jgi:hypothetical protein
LKDYDPQIFSAFIGKVKGESVLYGHVESFGSTVQRTGN